MKRKLLKPNLIFISLKDNILSIVFVLFLVGLVAFSKENLQACKDGINLWAQGVVPSLLPFFIACELLSYTNIIDFLGQKLKRIMRPIFNVPGEGAFPLVMGVISGYPVGAKIVTNFRKEKICTKEESERLLTFTNNSGPLFIIGTVGILLFGNTTIGLLLFITHLLSSITVGVIFRFWKSSKNSYAKDLNSIQKEKKSPPKLSSLGSILQASIMSSIKTIVMIGGFVVLFSVIISILNNTGIIKVLSATITPILSLLHIPSSFASGIISGIFELTNGVSIVSHVHIKAISLNIIICAFLLGFGGVSVLLQVLSIVSTSDISIKPYIIGKLTQGCIAALYTYIIIQNFTVFNFDI